MVNVGIIALSIDENVAKNKFVNTFIKYGSYDIYRVTTDCTIEAILLCQGFSLGPRIAPGLFSYSDDTVYNKGLTISEIRDYFFDNDYYKLVFSKYDYILLADDDFKFREGFMENLVKQVEFMENHPEIGILNSKDGNKYDDYQVVNPLKVGMRSGILVRSKGPCYDFIRFGGSHKIRYYEEAYLALNFYIKGYDCYKTNNCISHRTAGITENLRKKYGYYISVSPDLVTGWTVAEKLGYYIPNSKYNDHFHLGKFTELCNNLHETNQKLILRG